MSTDLSASFDDVEAAIQDIAEGKLVIVTDDEGRENEGDLVMAASKVTPEAVNMMIRHARGLICAPTTGAQLRKLGISPMVQENREAQKTAFTVSVVPRRITMCGAKSESAFLSSSRGPSTAGYTMDRK